MQIAKVEGIDSTGTAGNPVKTLAAGTSTLQAGGAPNTSISSSTATTILAAATRRVFWLQNVGTVTLLCRLGATATSSAYDVVLQGGTTNDDGTGGFWSASDWTGSVSVIAGSGTGRVAFGAY